MTDTLSKTERSRRMALIRGKDTKPEMLVRSLLHREGFRYRLHVASLPGKPDVVFHSRKKVIFIHGCFWHRHDADSCQLSRLPKSGVDFWIPKLEGNRKRDKQNILSLRKRGWKVLQIWECQIKPEERLLRRIKRFMQ